jgi:hypothetical protein
MYLVQVRGPTFEEQPHYTGAALVARCIQCCDLSVGGGLVDINISVCQQEPDASSTPSVVCGAINVVAEFMVRRSQTHPSLPSVLRIHGSVKL